MLVFSNEIEQKNCLLNKIFCKHSEFAFFSDVLKGVYNVLQTGFAKEIVFAFLCLLRLYTFFSEWFTQCKLDLAVLLELVSHRGFKYNYFQQWKCDYFHEDSCYNNALKGNVEFLSEELVSSQIIKIIFVLYFPQRLDINFVLSYKYMHFHKIFYWDASRER